MSLIIGVRCKDGCLVIADYRNRIESNGIITYEDNFEKVVKHDKYLLYNHGYNRIRDKDWKLRWQDLTPDDSNPIYKDILSEMKSKPDKSAFYVFINKDMLYEIEIKVVNGVKRIDHLPNGDQNAQADGTFFDQIHFNFVIELTIKREVINPLFGWSSHQDATLDDVGNASLS